METPAAATVRFSTCEVPLPERRGWLCEVIGREYVKVEVTPPSDASLFNEMTIQSWDSLRLSSIRSSAIVIERLPAEPYSEHQDAYFAVVLLSGHYALDQLGRSVNLKPGDITVYDATRPHRIHCPRDFSKLIISIPKALLRNRVAGFERCTALRIPGDQGVGAIASNFLQSVAGQAARLHPNVWLALAGQAIDLLTLAISSVSPGRHALSEIRSATLHLIKDFIERHLDEPELNTAMVANGVALSARYINDLFSDEDTSLMRHVWQRRLDRCRNELLDPARAGQNLTEIAFRWGFSDMSHFSRAFKQRYLCSPRAFRSRAGESITTLPQHPALSRKRCRRTGTVLPDPEKD